MNPSLQTIFTPSQSGGAATLNLTAAIVAYAMPAVDGSNTATTVQNSSSQPVWLAFGAAQLPAGPTVPGSVQVAPGATVLLTGDAATNAATATTATVNASAGGTVTIQRGTATQQQVFA